MSRLRSRRRLFAARPFAGRGVSLYAGVGEIVYRRYRLLGARWLGDGIGIGADSVAKTARLGHASHPATTITGSIGTEFHTQRGLFDVLTYRDDVERTPLGEPVPVFVNAALTSTGWIDGTVIGLRLVRLADRAVCRFRWVPGIHGTAPNRFRLECLTGSDPPAEVVTRGRGGGDYVLTTPALGDGGYTFRLFAEQTDLGVSRILMPQRAIAARSVVPSAPSGSVEIL